jgi:spore coat protein A
LIQIATDGGLLSLPVAHNSIPIAMAERVEAVIDFSDYPIGTRVMLQDLNGTGPLSELMRFDVVRFEHDDAVVPRQLSEIEPLAQRLATRTRDFIFSGRPSFRGSLSALWTINHKEFDPHQPIAEPRYGDTEIWHFVNHRTLGVVALQHSVHVHLISFRC